jgi:hypothetical protein
MFKSNTIKAFRRLIRKNDPRLVLTVPKELKSALEEIAKRHGRRLAIEVQMRLADSFEERTELSRDKLHNLIYNEKLAWKGEANPKQARQPEKDKGAEQSK